MGTQQFESPLDVADVTRADSLAREIFTEIANKWAFLIVDLLGERTMRFSELRNAIEGISHKMLTQNLRMMERNGLIERTVFPTVPPRVDYTLTQPGHVLRELVHGMCDWTHEYLGHIDDARTRFDADPREIPARAHTLTHPAE